MANTLQSIKLTATLCDLLPNVAFDLKSQPLSYLFEDAIAEAMYPGIPKDFLCGIGWNRDKAIESIRAIFTAAIVDSLTSTDEIANIIVDRVSLANGKIWVKELTLATTDPMDEQYARDALAKYVNADAANLIIESDIRNIAKGVFSDYIEPTASIDPRYADLVRMWKTRPMEFANMVYDFARQHPTRPWNAEGNADGTPEESAAYFIRWAVKNQVKLPANVSDPTATNEPTANTNNQTTTPMAKTANTTIPAGYKVAPAADPTNAEAIASQFAPQFEKALNAVSPSGAKLADCELVWSATTRPNDLPGRIITCKVVENEQTWHTFTFDCKDRHRDSTTYDEGMRFDWLSVDAMIKAFTGQASVLDCVKDVCKKRLMGPAAAPAPKAATKTAAEPQPQTAAPADPQPTEATTPAPMPKAHTKTAPTVNKAQLTVNNAQPAAAHADPQTPSVFQTYECSQTPAFYYHLYGEGSSSGIVVIHKETGDVRQHCANQTMDSSRAIIEKNAMTEVNPIPSIVITALIKEGVIKAPMVVNTPVNNDHADEKAATEKAAAEQREREEAEAKAAAEKAEQERLEQEKREAEERAEQERIEQEKAAAKAKAATIAPRHEKFDEVLWHVEQDIPVYLHGPAGTGKNVMCKQIAEQLGLEFSFANAVQNSFDILGYGDAQGRYVATEFYHAFTEGKLFMLDEMDASIPEVLVILNAAIANRYCVFPVVGKVDAHPNFRIVAAGNTIGTGADQNYTGRAAIDAASLNRFAKIALDYSHVIEMGITHNDGELVEFMEAMREAVKNANFDVVISYRQTIHLIKMVESGKFELSHCIRRTCLPTQNLDDIRIIAENIMTSGHNKYTAALKQLCEKMRRDSKYAA